MAVLLSSTRPTACKTHQCDACLTIIEEGTRYSRSAIAYDGRVSSWKSCTDCVPLNVEVWDWAYQPEDGVGPDEYGEWAEEHRDDPEHGEAARAYLARRGGASDGE